MELADYLRMLRDRWIAVTAMVVTCAVAALIYSSLQPQVYAATSSGFVTYGSAADANLANANDALSKSRAASYIGLAKDRETASIVIDDLDLDTTPEALVGDIEATQTPETVIINVTARSATPEVAQRLADSWMSALAERVADLESVEGDQGLRIEVDESALLPTSPESPQIVRNVVLAAVLGALLGVGYAVVRSLLDRRLRSPDEVESTSGVAVVGSIPDLPDTSGLFVTAQGADASARAAEEVRRIRTNLAYKDAGGAPRSIVVTSPSEGDGKTTVAVNLAAAIALTGQPVTLVDADLRSLDKSFAPGLDGSVGLTDVLGGTDLDAALQSYPAIAGLSVLTSGNPSSNPSEMLGSEAMQSLITELSRRGMVIVDAPSLLPVTDAAIVAHLAEGALVVVSAGTTRDVDLVATVEHLRAVRASTLGVVLNRTPYRKPKGRRNAVHTPGAHSRPDADHREDRQAAPA